MTLATLDRTVGWNRYGTVLRDADGMTAQDALSRAGLADWDVRLAPLTARVDGVDIPVPSRNVVLRGHGTEVEAMAVVGDRYHVVQNEELFSFADALIDEGARWESAGQFRNGKTVFGAFYLPNDIVIDPQGAADTIHTFLLVASSHDGTLPLTGIPTNVRVYCQNTLTMALKGAADSFKMRHTQSIEGKVQSAREAIGITFAKRDAWSEAANALYETSVSNAEFVKIVTDIYPKPESESKAALTRWENKVDLLGDLWNGGNDDIPFTNANITGTAWGALNALTERIDHHRTARGNDGEVLAEAHAGLVPAVQTEKNKILSRVLEFAKEKKGTLSVL